MIGLSRQRENSGCCFFLDISKAFSMIYPSILVAKLERDELDGWAASAECRKLAPQAGRTVLRSSETNCWH